MTAGDPGEEDETVEALMIRVTKLERELSSLRKNAARATRQLHAALLADLRAAEQEARQAEKKSAEAETRAAAAQRRARQAQTELLSLRSSSTWKAGRVVVAVPGRIKRWGRS